MIAIYERWYQTLRVQGLKSLSQMLVFAQIDCHIVVAQALEFERDA
jgi:hypothetical protein